MLSARGLFAKQGTRTKEVYSLEEKYGVHLEQKSNNKRLFA